MRYLFNIHRNILKFQSCDMHTTCFPTLLPLNRPTKAARSRCILQPQTHIFYIHNLHISLSLSLFEIHNLPISVILGNVLRELREQVEAITLDESLCLHPLAHQTEEVVDPNKIS